MQIRYLSRADVVALDISTIQVIETVEKAFLEKGSGRIEMPPKPGVHPGDGDNFIHAMPALVPALDSVGVKWVSGYPGNVALGLPYISGLLILNELETGIPTAIMDATWITGIRTAAASAVSARRLARSNSSSIGVLGCGVQGRFHVDTLRAVLPDISTVVAYDPDRTRAQAFADDVAQAHGIVVIVADEPEAAVRDMDVVVTAGPILRTPHATIGAGWLAPGSFATAVDFDSYWAAAALAELDIFSTDDRPQLEHFRELGYFQSIPPVDSDLGELVAGTRQGRTSDDQRTMACNLGVALEDVTVGKLVFDTAVARGVGTMLEA